MQGRKLTDTYHYKGTMYILPTSVFEKSDEFQLLPFQDSLEKTKECTTAFVETI